MKHSRSRVSRQGGALPKEIIASCLQWMGDKVYPSIRLIRTVAQYTKKLSLPSRIKSVIVRLALLGLISPRLATWLIQRGGLLDA